MLLFARIPTVFRLRCHYQKGIKRGSGSVLLPVLQYNPQCYSRCCSCCTSAVRLLERHWSAAVFLSRRWLCYLPHATKPSNRKPLLCFLSQHLLSPSLCPRSFG